MKDIEKKVANENKQSQESSDNYEFVTETIKSRPINKKKVFRKVVLTVFLAILFGLVASFTFILVFPMLQKKYYPVNDTKTVTVPVADEDNEEAPIEEFIPPETDELVDDGQVNEDDSHLSNEANEYGEDSENDGIETEETDKFDSVETDQVNSSTGDSEVSTVEGEITSDSSDEAANSEPIIINQVVETVEKSLELEDYRYLLRKISSIATNTQKSLVTVSGRKSNTDWFNNSYEDNNSSTGIIVGDNGKDLLVLSPTSILNSATVVDVTFFDGQTNRATIKLSDANTGLSIVAVPIDSIDEDTKGKIEMAQFGSISTSAVGMPVVAVGSPYGTAGSMGMGQITSNSIVVDKADSNVRLISTDIYGSTNATGVIVNYNGRIVGIICHENISSDMPNMIRAYSVSDITDVIEKMSNNQRLTTLGIIGTDVTKEANENYGVPYGAYVKEVVVDSPAMNVGIRNGDVIVKMGSTDISTFDDYKKKMLSASPDDVIVVTVERPDGSDYIEITYEVTLEELK